MRMYFFVYDDGFASVEYDGKTYVSDITCNGSKLISIDSVDGYGFDDYVSAITDVCERMSEDYLMNISDYEFYDCTITYDKHKLYIWGVEDSVDYYIGHIMSDGECVI